MKVAIKNFTTDALPEILMIILNFFLLKLFYVKLGTNTYALYQIFSQFFAYLVLAEAGFSSAALVSLYEPIAENNIKEINGKLAGIRYIFKIIGIIIIILGVIVSFIIPFFIKDNSFGFSYVQMTFVIYLISNSINYFFFTYRILYDANQKKYIANIVYQSGSIIKYIIEIISLLIWHNFIILLCSCIICNLLTNLFMKLYALNNNKYIDLNQQKDLSMLKTTKDLMVHKISGVIANNIDIILISTKMGLSSVAQYGAYNYILNEITKFTSKIGTSLYSVIGVKHFIKKNQNDNSKKFVELNSFMFFIATIICSTLVFSYNNFINLFYGQEMLLNNYIVLTFIFLIYFQIIRTTLNTFVNACGLFKETKICTIIEGITNLIFSIIGVKNLQIIGVLLATLFSYIIADFVIKPIVIKNKLRLFTLKQFYVEELKNSLCIILLLIINYYLFSFKASNLFIWFIMSGIILIINSIISFIFFKIINRIGWFNCFINLFKRRKHEV